MPGSTTSTSPQCAADKCEQRGTLRCSGCKTASYCSKDCQRNHFKTHKSSCTAFQKANCFLIRATPKTAAPVLDNISDQLEPFSLQGFGNETAEIRELKTRLGWKGADEVGKFYDHKGTTTWYYYVYGNTNPSGQPKNEVASLVCFNPVYGDVAVICSGPAGYDSPELFPRAGLTKTLEFYKTRDHREVFSKREHDRFMAKTGLPGARYHGHAHFYGNLAPHMDRPDVRLYRNQAGRESEVD